VVLTTQHAFVLGSIRPLHVIAVLTAETGLECRHAVAAPLCQRGTRDELCLLQMLAGAVFQL